MLWLWLVQQLLWGRSKYTPSLSKSSNAVYFDQKWHRAIFWRWYPRRTSRGCRVASFFHLPFLFKNGFHRNHHTGMELKSFNIFEWWNRCYATLYKNMAFQKKVIPRNYVYICYSELFSKWMHNFLINNNLITGNFGVPFGLVISIDTRSSSLPKFGWRLIHRRLLDIFYRGFLTIFYPNESDLCFYINSGS